MMITDFLSHFNNAYMVRALKQLRSGWTSEGFQKYSKNLGWLFTSRVFTMVVSLIATLFIARRLGPTNFGELDYALAIVSLFGWIGGWGIDTILNRELIKQPENKNVLMGTALVLRLFFCSLATLLIIIFSVVYSVDSVSKTLILLLAFTNILSVPQILQYDFLARADSKYPSLITMTVTLVTSLLKIGMIVNGYGLIYIVAVMLFEQVMYAGLYITIYRIKAQGNFFSWRFSSNIARLMIKTGSAIAFLSFFSILYSRIDQVMIRHFLDAEQLGLYSAGVRLVDLWGFIPTIILGGLYPAVLNARKISEIKYVNRLRKTLVLLLIPAVIASTFLFIFAPFLLKTIFGNAFVGGAEALQIYGLTLPVTFLSFFVMQVLYTDDHRKMLIVITAIPACINILLNLLLIPKYGIEGAAWSTLISYSFIIVLPFVFSQTRTKFINIFTAPKLVQ